MLVWYLIQPRKMRSRVIRSYPARLQQKDDDCLGYLNWEKWDSLWNGLQPEMISLMRVMSKTIILQGSLPFSHASGKEKRWSHETVFPRETFDDWENGSGTLGWGPQRQGIRAPSLSIFFIWEGTFFSYVGSFFSFFLLSCWGFAKQFVLGFKEASLPHGRVFLKGMFVDVWVVL
jgi:hypothetical protein